jgi:hypothetical protein
MNELLPNPTDAQVAASGYSSRRGYLKAYEQQRRVAKIAEERQNLIAGTGDLQPRSASRFNEGSPHPAVVAEFNRRRLDRQGDRTDEKEESARQAYRAAVHLRGTAGCPEAMARFGNLLGFTDPAKLVAYIWSPEAAKKYGNTG